MHLLRYGTNAPEERAEIVSLRATVTGADEEAAAGADRPGRRRAAECGATRHSERSFSDRRLSKPRPSRADAARRQPHRRPGADRGARVDDRAAARRPLQVDGFGNLVIESGRTDDERNDKPQADPVLTEIVRNGVLAVTEEMKSNLMRTAYNMIIYEALDFTVGLFTADGGTVSIGMGLPSFIRGMANVSRPSSSTSAPTDIEPGDILVTNDAYTTGSHLNHFTFSCRSSSAASCAAGPLHGALARRRRHARRRHHRHLLRGHPDPDHEVPEGAGVVNQDLVDIIRMNVRIPERAMGDLRAQITAVKTGERRFLELLDRYGREQVLARSQHHGPLGGGGARAHARRSPTASTRPSPSWTTTASTSASACRSRCR